MEWSNICEQLDIYFTRGWMGKSQSGHHLKNPVWMKSMDAPPKNIQAVLWIYWSLLHSWPVCIKAGLSSEKILFIYTWSLLCTHWFVHNQLEKWEIDIFISSNFYPFQMSDQDQKGKNIESSHCVSCLAQPGILGYDVEHASTIPVSLHQNMTISWFYPGT